jgi:DNA polymerase-3 subunit epsilon
MVDLEALIDGVPIAVLDVETTGLDPTRGDRVCEIAILRSVGREPVDAYQHLIHPQRRMRPGALRVHGITDEMLAGQPTFPEVARDVLEVMEGAVLVGHNLAFDLGFIETELARAGLSLGPYVGLDTLRLARRLYTRRRYGLGALAASLGLAIDGRAHRAMADVLLTRLVFHRILEDVQRDSPCTVRHLHAMQGGRIHQRRPTPLPVPPIIREALEDACPLWLRYRAADGTESERTVTPLRVEEGAGACVLVAVCHLRHERRMFRLDRIIAMRLAPEG